MCKGVIYGLICPAENRIRYIGQTIQCIRIRLKQHKQYSIKAKTHLGSWLRLVKKQGLLDLLDFVILEDEVPCEDLNRLEISHIASHQDLVNTLTGDLIKGTWVRSEEWRLRQSKLATEMFTGKNHSEKTKQKISDSKKIWWSKNTNYKITNRGDRKKAAVKLIKRLYQYDKSMNLIKIWDGGAKEASESLGIKPERIYQCACGPCKTGSGFIWKYEEKTKNLNEMAEFQIIWTPEKKERAIAYLTNYFKRHGVGEMIMQSDDALLEAPELLSDIADDVLIEGEGITYTDEDE